MFDRNAPKSAKELTCAECTVETAMYYNELWHSRLPKTNKGNLLRNTNVMFFSATYDLHFFAVAMWTTPVAANRMKYGSQILELRRLAISPDAPKFTATWMIAKMVKQIKRTMPQISKLVSYQDTEVHTGTIYKAANWTLETAQSSYATWNTQTRIRTSVVQSNAPKHRWGYVLRPWIEEPQRKVESDLFDAAIHQTSF